MELQWTETFSMAGAMQIVQAGSKALPHPPSPRPLKLNLGSPLSSPNLVTVRVVSNSIPILPGQAFTLPPGPDEPTVTASPRAPRDGFLYHTARRSWAILTQPIGGKEIAIFTTPEADPLPANANEAIRLFPTIKIWFEQGANVGAVVDLESENVDPLFADMSQTSAVQVNYSKDGQWSFEVAPAVKGLEVKSKTG